MKSSLKEKLRLGRVTVGGWIGIGHPDVAEIMAYAGFDWLIIDMEHTPLAIDIVQELIRATKDTDTAALVRVAWNDPVLVKPVLDAGAHGIVFPDIRTREEAEKAVRACRYATKGIRGVAPRRASRYYSRLREYLAEADEGVIVVLLIESAEAVKNIEQILTVEGVDATAVGHMDLAATMGYLNELPNLNPEVVKSIDRVLQAHKGTSVAPGIYAGSVEAANRYIAQGFKFIGLCEDIDYLVKMAEDVRKVIRQ